MKPKTAKRDGQDPCRYVDCPEGGKKWGEATLHSFVSHPWGAKWGTLVAACRHPFGGDTAKEEQHR